MWGYISSGALRGAGSSVPSLYVRVYRVKTPYTIYTNRSLIICEGISHPRIWYQIIRMFPHYMWGYIVLGLKDKALTSVPSLYVRVYHSAIISSILSRCSLIICEGISLSPANSLPDAQFPHYMWVYIEIGNGILQASKNINVVNDSIPQIA